MIREILHARQRLDESLNALQAECGVSACGDNDGPIAPASDLYETDEAFVVVIELPGARAEEIDLQLQGDKLRVSGRIPFASDDGDFVQVERLRGGFRREFLVPGECLDGAPRAKLESGVLTVWLGKSPRERPRRISVVQQEGS